VADEEFSGDEYGSGDAYVVCSKCGARIKATRQRCLRCFEPLHVDHTQQSAWRSLRISDQVGAIVAAIALVAVGALVWVLYSTSDQSAAVDSTAKPAERPNPLIAPPRPVGSPAPGSTAGDAAAPADAASAPAPAGEPAASADDLESTRQSFEEKLKTNPNDPVALNGLGLALQGLGRPREALDAFRRACEAAPRNATARMNLAALEARMGNWDKAAVEYRIASRLIPDDYLAHYSLAMALQQTHDDQGAIPEFETAVQVSPREAAAHRGLAASLERVGRGADAAREYQRALELAPDAPEANAIREKLQRLPKL
jgi:Flp pilus assembly protein TadD